jgi:hypothetical protein
MAKIQKVSQTITPFAGVYFTNREFNRCGLSQLIDKELGVRTSAGYRYSDIFRSWFDIFFCGGDVAEDIAQHLRPTLESLPSNKVPSPDTLLRGIKELAVKNTEVTSSTGKRYQFNINRKLNELNVKFLMLTGQLQKDEFYDFDYDNQIIAHEKFDAKKTYKMNTGYFPGVATIGDKVVYLENRDGNANVKLEQAKTLENGYKLLNENKIYVNRSRMDAGSYAKEIIDTVDKYSKLFYIRANRCDTMTEQIRQIENWQPVTINFKSYEVASTPFKQFFEDRSYRLVVMREKTENRQLDLFTGDSFSYRSILTNDHQSTEEEVIVYYNQRGGSEKMFDIQNNDFGWKHLPCSDMHHNTVYLLLTALLKNFYNHIAQKVSTVFHGIFPTTRLKRFIFRFICVCGKWVRQGRQRILKLYTEQPYEQLE